MPQSSGRDPLWTAVEIAVATGGRMEGAGFEARGITFNSKEVEPGDLFVALKGARDGHEFVAAAFEAGAAGALVERPVDGGPCIVVPDTLKGLEALGFAARDRAPQVRRGVVTGSVGKTSVTQAIKAGLDLAGPAHASVKSFNNHIGVPLTLARMPADVERAVFEIGMNAPGEIAPLSRMVQPHAACVTTVGPVHIEGFADGEAGVAREKAAIFEGLGPGGVAVINGDNDWTPTLRQAALRAGARVVCFGTPADADARLIDFTPNPDGARVEAEIFGRHHVFSLRQSGFHWGHNCLAVILMLDALDVPVETALQALSAFQPLAGRGQNKSVAIRGGAFLLIDESYNANPLSMRAGFLSLGARPVAAGGRRMVALTDMLELVHTAGPLMKHLHEALRPERRGLWRETAADLAEALVEEVRPGDIVMVKGSNGSKASVIAAALADMERRRDAQEGDAS